ncbi:MAG: SH3 domain-containing protein, partial [Thermomicrobiales bacterium]
TATASATPSGQAIVTGTGGLGVNCRSGAGMSFGVIAVFAEGATVPVRGATQAGWVPVRCGGRDGWVSADYLRLIVAQGGSPAEWAVLDRNRPRW